VVKGKTVHFFALREDLLPLLQRMEETNPLKYASMETASTPVPVTFVRAKDLPDLCEAHQESSVACASYLVTPPSTAISARRVELSSGPVVYHFSQLNNADTIVISPGGLWKPDIVLYGRFGTISESPISQKLMRSFRAELKRRFTRVRAYWVGAKAMELFDAGARLTSAEQCPTIYDLRRPD
jgi:hypothetical protein